LLVKIIDANDDLSVQVHPNDEYAAARGLESGKSEMWYVMEAPPGQSLIIGLADGAGPEKLRKDPMSCLHRLPIKKGDIINIPAGLVHAITKGVMVAEIQQNSDITYRLYDYGRVGLDGKPRELHFENGVAAADFNNLYPKEAVTGARTVVNAHFTVDEYVIDGSFSEKSDPETFTVFTCVEGSCSISGVELPCSRSAFIPAGLGLYDIKGKAVLLKSFVPDYSVVKDRCN
jgi:mannose-6-phosphate isomerase